MNAILSALICATATFCALPAFAESSCYFYYPTQLTYDNGDIFKQQVIILNSGDDEYGRPIVNTLLTGLTLQGCRNEARKRLNTVIEVVDYVGPEFGDIAATRVTPSQLYIEYYSGDKDTKVDELIASASE